MPEVGAPCSMLGKTPTYPMLGCGGSKEVSQTCILPLETQAEHQRSLVSRLPASAWAPWSCACGLNSSDGCSSYTPDQLPGPGCPAPYCGSDPSPERDLPAGGQYNFDYSSISMACEDRRHGQLGGI